MIFRLNYREILIIKRRFSVKVLRLRKGEIEILKKVKYVEVTDSERWKQKLEDEVLGVNV